MSQGRREKVARTFRKGSRERGVFFWYFGIWGGFLGLIFSGRKFRITLQRQMQI